VTPSGGRNSSQVTATTEQASFDAHWCRASGGSLVELPSVLWTPFYCGRAGRGSSVPIAVSIIS
jgi:hypothetical protein